MGSCYKEEWLLQGEPNTNTIKFPLMLQKDVVIRLYAAQPSDRIYRDDPL